MSIHTFPIAVHQAASALALRGAWHSRALGNGRRWRIDLIQLRNFVAVCPAAMLAARTPTERIKART